MHNLSLPKKNRFEQLREYARDQLDATLKPKEIDYTVNTITNALKRDRIFGNCIAGFVIGFHYPYEWRNWQFGRWELEVVVTRPWWRRNVRVWCFVFYE